MTKRIGAGVLPQVGEDLEGSDSCFVVADPTAYSASGAEDILRPYLSDLGGVEVYSDFTPNPEYDSVERALQQARTLLPDTVMAVGGGTAIDIAKLVAAAIDRNLSDVIADPDGVGRSNKLIAIPTTAGTGSEATHFAVLYIDGEKHSIASACLRPDVCVVDPDLLSSVPSSVAAHTGLDALCQSIESLWSVNSDAESTTFALDGLRLSVDHLPLIVKSPSSENRYGMARAAHASGKAIDISKTTASHALSYKLTSAFDVPHGLAVALTIPPCLKWNAAVAEDDCIDPRGVSHVRSAVDAITNALSCESADQAADSIDELIESLGFSIRLRDYGVSRSDVNLLAKSVNAERLGNNPRRLSEEDIKNLLKERW